MPRSGLAFVDATEHAVVAAIIAADKNFIYAD
jgi:hypothetical protein